MKQTLLLFPVILFALSGYSQKKEIPLRDYFNDAEFFFVSEEYPDALHDYLELYNKGYANNANINYRLGVCYLNIPGQKQKSIDYLRIATKNASNKYTGSTMKEQYAPMDAFLYLGNAYRINNQLDSAIDWYSRYIQKLPEQAKAERTYAKKQIETCVIAKEYQLDPQPVKFENMGSVINTNAANHNCVVSGDGTTMVYMTKLPFYEAVFMSKKRGDNWSRPVNITPQIMSDGDQIVCDISYYGNTILLAKEDEFNSDIYISYFENGQWEKSKPISKNINTRFWESHASFSKDGKTIYFTSNMPGGLGMVDIYSSTLQDNGDWSNPVNLGDKINTPLSEDTPFITEDGNALYFSSQGHTNMGGYDFFVTYKTDSGWSGAENLKFPLNTTDDDVFYYPWNNGEIGYVHKILDDTKGSWDIYRVEFIIEKELQEEITEQVVEDVDEEEEMQIPEEQKLPIAAEPVVIEYKPVLFGFDNYKLTAEAKEDIDKILIIIKENKDLNVKIVGYTDALGPEKYNQMLSERRAVTVLNYLISKGIDKERLSVLGKGEMDFIAINSNPDGSDNPEARKYNRRVEFEIIQTSEKEYVIKRINIVPEEYRFTGN